MIGFEFAEGLLFLQAEACQLKSTAKLRFILDTGAAGSAVDINLIRPDYSRHSRFVRLSGVGGEESALVQQLDSLKMGIITLRDIEFQFGDLENSFGVQGIIGNNILNKYLANIDYSSKSLAFSRSPS